MQNEQLEHKRSDHYCSESLLIVQREPWINVQILKKAWNFAEMLNMPTLNILAIVPPEIWSDTRFILSWKMRYQKR